MPYSREQKTQNIKKLKSDEKQNDSKNNPPLEMKPLNPLAYPQ
ncbi:hypothetical protein [Helicobacter pylori]|nr:hypothetical protein [Helicobacter pylori]